MRQLRSIKVNPQKTREKVLPLVMNNSFQNDVKSLRKKWQIDDETNPDAQMDRLLWDKGFHSQVVALMKKYKLGENWQDWLYSYLIYDDESSFNPESFIIFEPQKGQFAIKVYSSTNLDEVKRAFKVIKQLQGKDTNRMRFTKNQKRDREIYKLSQRGESIKNITSIMIKRGYDIDSGNTKTIISRMKKKLKNKA